MSLNLLAVQDSIATKLKELSQDVYETAAPEDSKLRFDSSGMILPYIVIEYADMYEATGAAGIVSSRYDVKTSYVVVSCIAPTERSARQVAELVRDKLTGYTPTDAGELRLSGGGVAFTAQEAKPNRYIAELAFTFPVNIVW
jgi:hypothetical protein